jgi:hypothetical protein
LIEISTQEDSKNFKYGLLGQWKITERWLILWIKCIRINWSNFESSHRYLCTIDGPFSLSLSLYISIFVETTWTLYQHLSVDFLKKECNVWVDNRECISTTVYICHYIEYWSNDTLMIQQFYLHAIASCKIHHHDDHHNYGL